MRDMDRAARCHIQHATFVINANFAPKYEALAKIGGRCPLPQASREIRTACQRGIICRGPSAERDLAREQYDADHYRCTQWCIPIIRRANALVTQGRIGKQAEC